MILEVFLRDEQKYYLNQEQYNKLIPIINQNLIKDNYYNERIYNLYFDNINNDFIINSLNKPLFKEKIRLRSYTIPQDDDNVFLEIKRKYDGLTSKRRIVMTYKDFNNYLVYGIIPNISNDQKYKELDYYLKHYKLEPKVNIVYDRLSYVSKDDSSFRLTIDSNLKSSTSNLQISNLNNDDSFFSNNYIMEIKTLNGMPLWLVKSISDLKIYPVSFSKYGEIFKYTKECGQNV